MAKKNPYRHENKSYDLRVEDVAEQAKRTVRWVYAHAEQLGGVKKAWLADSTGNKRATIRFNGPIVKRMLKDMGLSR